MDAGMLVSVEALKDPQDKMEPAYTPSPLQSASFSRIPFCLPPPSALPSFFLPTSRVQVFPHANAKSMELLGIIATMDTAQYWVIVF